MGQYSADRSRPRPFLIKLNWTYIVNLILSNKFQLSKTPNISNKFHIPQSEIKVESILLQKSMIELGTDRKSINFLNTSLFGHFKVINPGFQDVPTLPLKTLASEMLPNPTISKSCSASPSSAPDLDSRNLLTTFTNSSILVHLYSPLPTIYTSTMTLTYKKSQVLLWNAIIISNKLNHFQSLIY